MKTIGLRRKRTTPRRNGRVDPTQHITPAQRRNARNAFLVAARRGTPLNTFLTVNFCAWRGPGRWMASAEPASQVSRLRQRLIKALDDWFRRHDLPSAWVAVLENPPQGGRGPGIHILLHLPPSEWLEKRKALHDCLRKVMDWDSRELATLEAAKRAAAKPQWVRLPFYFSIGSRFGPLSAPDQERKLAYMLKGCSPDEEVTIAGVTKTLAEHNGDLARGEVITLEPQGDPYTKRRVEASRILAKKARATAGWQEDEDDTWLHRDARLTQRKNAVLALLRGKFQPAAVPIEPDPAATDEPEWSLEMAIRALESLDLQSNPSAASVTAEPQANQTKQVATEKPAADEDNELGNTVDDFPAFFEKLMEREAQAAAARHAEGRLFDQALREAMMNPPPQDSA